MINGEGLQFIWNVIIFILSLILADYLRKIYMRTNNITFHLFAYGIIVFGLLALSEGILEFFFEFDVLDVIGFHQILEILLLAFLIFLFRPKFKQDVKGG